MGLPLLTTVMRGLLPAHLDWIADAVGDLADHIPTVIDATPGGVWSSDSEAAVIELCRDVFDEIPALSLQDEEDLSVAVAIIVRLIVTAPRRQRGWRARWDRP
jgi:hypothetical protein